MLPQSAARSVVLSLFAVACGAPSPGGAHASSASASAAGGPDRDGDGVPDALDKCPNIPDSEAKKPEHAGCPCTGSAAGSQWEGPPIAFAKGAANLYADKDNQAALDAIAAKLPKLGEGRRVEVVGYSDSSEDAAYDWLAKTRAQSVADWLVDHGIDKGRVVVEVGRAASVGEAADKGRPRNPVVVVRMDLSKSWNEICEDW